MRVSNWLGSIQMFGHYSIMRYFEIREAYAHFGLGDGLNSGGGLEVLYQPFEHPGEVLWGSEWDQIDCFHKHTI